MKLLGFALRSIFAMFHDILGKFLDGICLNLRDGRMDVP